MTLIIVGSFLSLLEVDRQHRLRPRHGLDLALLVEAEYHRARWRIKIQAHNIDNLLGKLRIPGNLERALPVRLKAFLQPQLGDEVVRHADAFVTLQVSRHLTAGPVRQARLLRRAQPGERDDSRSHLPWHRTRPYC